MFSQKQKEITDQEAKTEAKDSKPIFSVSPSDDWRPYQKPAKTKDNKPDWFLKTCGIGLFILSIFTIDEHPLYALVFIGIGIACCFAAHGEPPSTE